MALGAAAPSLIAGCSADEEGNSGIFEPENEGNAAKLASVEKVKPDNYEIHLKEDYVTFLLTLAGNSGDKYYYSGYKEIRNKYLILLAVYDINTAELIMHNDYGSGYLYMVKQYNFYPNMFGGNVLARNWQTGECTLFRCYMDLIKGSFPS